MGARLAGGGAGAVCVALAGCYAYEAAPQDPLAILRELERAVAVAVDADTGASPVWPAQGLTAGEAAALAVAGNPNLVALRAEVGVGRAELAEAGLLADVMVGWNAMDAVAVEATGGTATTVEFLAGLGISWRVPRPGELGAEVGAAEANVDAARQRVLAVEWQLVRAVHESFLDVLGARARLEVNGELLATAARVAEQLQRAREVGGATAIQANLAAVERAALERERVRLDGELRRAQQRLNERLGISPGAAVPLAAPPDPFAPVERPLPDPAALAEQAVQRRPDVQRLLALYRAAEEEVRLQVARQWPAVEIGTGIAVWLPLFRSFNALAVRTAVARRERLALELRAAVHTLRAEAHAAVLEVDDARRRVQSLEQETLPRLRESLELAGEALRLGEVTLLEVLTLQRQVLEARTAHLDARIARARAELAVETVTGSLPLGRGEPPPEEEPER